MANSSESMLSVHQKIYRAREHFIQLLDALVVYYKTQPGHFVEAPDSTPQQRKVTLRERDPLPARIGLICGDFLQCLRSSLDYLVWELVIAAGNTPGKQNMFPIATTSNQYENEIKKRLRLDGIDPGAAAIIDAFQPYHAAEKLRDDSPLAILEMLTNINKHRRVLFTEFRGNLQKPILDFPHVHGIFCEVDQAGRVIQEIPIWAYARFQDGAVNGFEITATLDGLARFIGEEVLPPFEKFFK